jgi:hypothetical protein
MLTSNSLARKKVTSAANDVYFAYSLLYIANNVTAEEINKKTNEKREPLPFKDYITNLSKNYKEPFDKNITLNLTINGNKKKVTLQVIKKVN